MSWRATAISAVTDSSLIPASPAARSHSSSDARSAWCASGATADEEAVMNVPWPGRPFVFKLPVRLDHRVRVDH